MSVTVYEYSFKVATTTKIRKLYFMHDCVIVEALDLQSGGSVFDSWLWQYSVMMLVELSTPSV